MVRTADSELGTAADLKSLRSRVGIEDSVDTKLRSVSGYLFRPVSGRDERQTSMVSERSLSTRSRGSRSVRRRFKEPVLVSGVGRPECSLFLSSSYHYS
jgi:hypothetical protein